MRPALAASWAPTKPKLVVVMVIDQFRADYLSRYRSEFRKDGFQALMNNGAYYPYGEYDVLQAMTAPGHATILTGAYPYQMGIPINDWYDQKTHSDMYCVEDRDVKSVGSDSATSASPKNLIGSTVGDELKNVDSGGKVVGLALKDRAAVLLAGHRADLAFWWDMKKLRWVTSSYYRKDGKLPEWLEKLNVKNQAKTCDLGEVCGVDLTVAAFKAALTGENMGRSAGPDILAVSFSTHDIAGHRFGPNSPQIKKITLAEDKAVAEIRAAVAAQVAGGLANVLFVLTGDHGVAPAPDYLKDTRLPSGQVSEPELIKSINEMLTKKYGASDKGGWIATSTDFNFFLDEEKIRGAKLDIHKMQTDIKALLLQTPEFAQVVTADDIEAGKLPPGAFARQLQKTYYPGRSGHVIALLKPFYIMKEEKKATTHMTGYAYDRMVPILFSGFGIKNGLFAEKAEVIDIAPTLSFILGVIPPALSEGRVLSEALLKSTH